MVYEMPITQQTPKEAVQTTLLSAPCTAPLPHTHTKQTPPLDLPSRRFNICSIKQPPLPPPSFSPSSTMNRIIKQQTKNKKKKIKQSETETETEKETTEKKDSRQFLYY